MPGILGVIAYAVFVFIFANLEILDVVLKSKANDDNALKTLLGESTGTDTRIGSPQLKKAI